jgi:hypothetical protein
MMSPRRRVLYLSVVLLIMLETLKRFSDSTAYSISMWIMEFFVLLLIGYEVGSGILYSRKKRERIAGIFGLMSAGYALQRRSPNRNADQSTIDEWISSVNDWIKGTSELLHGYSAQAEAAFLLGTRHDASYPGVAFAAEQYFGLLITRLDNLQGIMEKPEVYF